MVNNNLMICTSSKKALHLNESKNDNQKYILEGVFAELDTLNRNQRIYPKDEYLKHLQYLRNDIKSGQPLLGELDHPDDRYEVKLKEASHRIIDIWYDAASNKVMGKVELLNTPNGKLAQSIVDQGIPLHISSRAAGTINNDKTVSIQQIYTYDLVCKPGFAGAVLHRVNESAETPAYSEDAHNFLVSSNKTESMNCAGQYGLLNENVSVSEVHAAPILRKEAKELQINNIEKVNESDMVTPLTDIVESDINLATELPMDPTAIVAEDDDKAETAADEKDTEDVSDAEPAEDDSEENTDDEEKESDGVEIIDVKGDFDDNKEEDDDIILDVKPEDEDGALKDDTSAEDNESEESDEESDDTEDKADECDTADSAQTDKPSEKTKLFEDPEAVTELTNRQDKFDKKFDDLIKAIKEKNSKKEEAKACESVVMAQYPISMLMSESNLAKFISLTESQKNKVVDYCRDNVITDAKTLNENWENGINYSGTPVWLKYAPEEYRSLYENASADVRESISCTADYCLFESQSDINRFWENTGLANVAQRQQLNEQFISTLPKVQAAPVNESLPYGKDYIDAITQMACEYN